MTPDEQKEAKKIMLEHRANGAKKKDCAILAGIARDSLYRWLKEDKTFRTRFSKARRDYKMALLKGTKARDPKWLLEREWKDEYHLEKEDATNSITVMGNLNVMQIKGMNEDQLKARLAELQSTAVTVNDE